MSNPFCCIKKGSCLIAETIGITGAEDRNRTGTIFEDRRILSPVRLPVPPLRHILILVIGQYNIQEIKWRRHPDLNWG